MTPANPTPAKLNQSVIADYQGQQVSFTESGWFNATQAAERYGKNPHYWLRLDETREYITAVLGVSNTSQNRIWIGEKDLIKTKRGNNGGTWLHPDLAVAFARWLDVRFGVWCDMQIKALLTGKHTIHDSRRLRSESAASYKVLCGVLQIKREHEGKESKPCHFMNEARLVNWALTGEFRSLDRDALNDDEQLLLAKLEEQDAVLIGAGLEYEQRKQGLFTYSAMHKAKHRPKIEAANGTL